MLDTIKKVMTSDVEQAKYCESNGNALKTPWDSTVECIFGECQIQVFMTFQNSIYDFISDMSWSLGNPRREDKDWDPSSWW